MSLKHELEIECEEMREDSHNSKMEILFWAIVCFLIAISA